MIEQHIYISKYNWHLTIIYNVCNKCISHVADALFEIRCPANKAIEALSVISNINTGFCYSNFKYRKTLISIARTDSVAEFVDTVIHEVKHLQSHICEYYGISEASEEAAYLIGDTVKQLYLKLEELWLKTI